MDSETSNRFPRGGLLILALAALSLLYYGFGGRNARQEPPGLGTTAPESQPPPKELRGPAAEPVADRAGEVRALAPEERLEPARSRLLCLRRSDREPVAGISIFAGDVLVGGPSEADGVLEFVRGRAQALTVWSEGWVPVFIRVFETTPQTVLLEETAAVLEVQLLNLDPGDEIVRSLLQPHAFHVTGGDPWAPVLKERSRDQLAADRLPPGDYDVYVWIARRPEPPRCLSASGVRVEGQGPAVIELDAAAPPDPEPDG